MIYNCFDGWKSFGFWFLNQVEFHFLGFAEICGKPRCPFRLKIEFWILSKPVCQTAFEPVLGNRKGYRHVGGKQMLVTLCSSSTS